MIKEPEREREREGKGKRERDKEGERQRGPSTLIIRLGGVPARSSRVMDHHSHSRTPSGVQSARRKDGADPGMHAEAFKPNQTKPKPNPRWQKA